MQRSTDTNPQLQQCRCKPLHQSVVLVKFSCHSVCSCSQSFQKPAQKPCDRRDKKTDSFSSLSHLVTDNTIASILFHVNFKLILFCNSILADIHIVASLPCRFEMVRVLKL